MNNRARILIPLFLGVFILLCGAANSDAKHLQKIRYHYIDLGTLGGTFSWSTGINNWGQVVGLSETETGEVRAFVWIWGKMKDLGVLDGDSYSGAWSINDKGRVVGCSGFGNERRPVLWDRSGLHELETLGGTYADAFGINRHGEIVGWGSYPGETYYQSSHAVSWNQEGIADMTPFQSDFSVASSINKKGEKVGGYVNADSDGFFRAVLWGKHGVRELGTLGGDESEAYWINDKGEAVGWCDLPEGGWHACLWTPHGDTVDLGALDGSDSAAFSINDHGDVVGTSYFYVDDNTLERSRAFIWTKKNGMQDLNTLVDLPSGVIVAEGNSINDFGWIAGTAVAEGNSDLFTACLLIPYKNTKEIEALRHFFKR